MARNRLIDDEEYDRLMFAFGQAAEEDEAAGDGQAQYDGAYTTPGRDDDAYFNAYRTPQRPSTSPKTNPNAFATPDNVEDCVPYLNQSLAHYGYPARITLPTTSSEDSAAICNTLYGMLQQRQRDLEFRSTQEDTMRRLRSDNQAVELQLGRLNERLVAKERELGNRMVKERTLTDAQAGDKRKLKEERDEAQRALTQMQQKSSQFQHELRKKDRAYAKLQEHLNGLLEEQRRERRSAVDAVAVMKANKAKGAATKAPVTGARAAKATAADNADLYTMMMDSYEAKQAALVQENSDMRHALVSMEAEMKALMNENDTLKAAAAAVAAAQQHSRARAMPVWAEHDERFADVKHGRVTSSPTDASASRSDMTASDVHRAGPAAMEEDSMLLQEPPAMPSQDEVMHALRRFHYEAAGGGGGSGGNPTDTDMYTDFSSVNSGTTSFRLPRNSHNSHGANGGGGGGGGGGGDDGFPAYMMAKEAALKKTADLVAQERSNLSKVGERLAEEQHAFRLQQQKLEAQKNAFRSAMSSWAPGGGAGTFPARKAEHEVDESVEGSHGGSVRGSGPEHVRFSFGDN